MRKQPWKRLLSVVMVLAMCLSLVIPAYATGTDTTSEIEFEKVDNNLVSTTIPGREDVDGKDTEPAYKDTDVVRVSIVLEEESTVEKYNTVDILWNSAAQNYRDMLLRMQENLADMISRSILGGEALDVVWNLTFAANIISANVEYGQIEEIEEMDDVAEVLIETRYEPMVVNGSETADPSMATSSAQIGTNAAYAAGYTGAGSKVAIIDTGLDTDHQSFDAAAFQYALGDADVDLLTVEDIAAVLDQLNIKGFEATAEDLYVNAKVPFGFNYIDESLDITHDNDAQGGHGSHVAGIAAANDYIPAGDGYTHALDSVLTQGVAPHAQLMIMKVFGQGGGAYDSDYMVAIEDALVLGADAINLSLGSGNPGTSRCSEAEYQSIMDNLTNAGAVVSMSAGNSGHWAEQTSYGYLYHDGVSLQMDGSPGSYTNSLGVASVDNDGVTGAFFTVGDNYVFYNESAEYGNAPMTTIAGEHEYVFLDDVGVVVDENDVVVEDQFAALGDAVKGKVAYCYRGTSSFFQKANAAVEAGAVAVVICNNTSGVIGLNLTGYEGTAPVVSITQADGAAIKAASTPVLDAEGNVLYYTGTMTVSNDVGAAGYDSDYYTMSAFSSWGVPGSLELKPEITAPGGSIYSVDGEVAGGQSYITMSGTSMAAPQVAGMAALIAQYIREENLAEGAGVRHLAQSLLMSTAKPLIDATSGGNYYSVLNQGAGLANVGAAIGADSYITMHADATDSYADGKVKVELGDDPDRNGIYSFGFTLNNLTDTDQSYLLSADMFTQDVFDGFGDGSTYFMDTWTAPLSALVTFTVNGEAVNFAGELIGMDFDGNGTVNELDVLPMLDYTAEKIETFNDFTNADLDADGDVDSYDAYLFLKKFNEGTVTLPADGAIDVQVTVALLNKGFLDAYYPTGAYVEGFVYAETLTTEEGVLGTQHSIPVLGYYGNWSDPSMFDVGTYTEYASGEEYRLPYLYNENSIIGNTLIIKYPTGTDVFGGNPYGAWLAENGIEDFYIPGRDALSLTNDSVLSKWQFALIRNAAASMFVMENKTQESVLSAYELGAVDSAYYYVNGGYWVDTTQTLNLQSLLNFETVAEGDEIALSLIMAPEYYVDAAGNTDWEALGAGSTMTESFVIDNTAPDLKMLMFKKSFDCEKSDQLILKVKDNQHIAAIALYSSDGELLSLAGATAEAEANQDLCYTLDVPDGSNEMLLQICDYAMNVTTYRFSLCKGAWSKTTAITLNPTEAITLKGGNVAISATIEPWESNDTLTWSTSDPAIAVVNDKGVVTGVGAGTCIITATSVNNPTVSATCTVTVQSLEADLNGIVWDENGQVWWSEFNTATIPAYEKLSAESAAAPLASAAYGPGGKLYAASLDTSSLVSSLYVVDPANGFTETLIGDSSIGYMDLAYAPNLTDNGYLLGLYGGYIVLIDSTTGEYVGAFDWATTNLVGIAYYGSLLNENYNEYMDMFLLIDAEGNCYLEAFICLDGDFYFFSGPEDGFVGNLGYATDVPFFQSAYYDGTYLYWSKFVEAENKVDLIAFDCDNTGNIYNVASFADGVWPVGGLFQLADSTESAGALAEGMATATVSDAQLQTEVAKLNVPSVSKRLPVIGGLNTVSDEETVEKATKPVAEETANIVTVEVTAQQAATNGKFTVAYDAEVLEYVSCVVDAKYYSINAQTGEVILAFAQLDEIPADEVIATITFKQNLEDATDVVATNDELNDENPDTSEVFTFGCDHTNTEIRDAKDATCTEEGYTGDTYCTDCGKLISEGEVTAKLAHKDADGDNLCDGCGRDLSTVNPDTGDSFSMGMYATMLIATLAAVVVLLLNRKRLLAK